MSAAITRGVALTMWHPSGLHKALDPATRVLLSSAGVDAVMLHGAPSHFLDPSAGAQHLDVVVRALRDLIPGVRLLVGVGCNGVAKRFLSAAWTETEAVERLAQVARVGQRIGAEALVLDPEATWKQPMRSERGGRVRALAHSIMSALRECAPTLALGHTAYDHPTLHGTYPWAAWCGEGGCDFAMPQVYAAPKKGMGDRHALDRRVESHRASWEVATRLGLIRPGLPVHPYFQAHDVPAAQTIRHVIAAEFCALWSAPVRIDEDGFLALRAACELRRRGQTVEAFQRENGLVDDGICGEKTLAKLGIARSAHLGGANGG